MLLLTLKKYRGNHASQNARRIYTKTEESFDQRVATGRIGEIGKEEVNFGE